MLVVITPGPRGSGLDYFCQRDLRVLGKLMPIVQRITPAWRESPSATVDALPDGVPVPRAPATLAERLRRAADAVLKQEGVRSGRVLFWVQHTVVRLGGPAGAEPAIVSPEDLLAYCRALRKAAAELAAPGAVRVFAHVPVQDPGPEDLQKLERLLGGLGAADTFRVEVLPLLDREVPWEELEVWLDNHDIPYDETHIEDYRAGRRSYEDLILWLLEKFPVILEPTLT